MKKIKRFPIELDYFELKDLSIFDVNLLSYISFAINDKEYCFPSNVYLAGIFHCSPSYISKRITKIANMNYIELKFHKKDVTKTNRYIYLTDYFYQQLEVINSITEVDSSRTIVNKEYDDSPTIKDKEKIIEKKKENIIETITEKENLSFEVEKVNLVKEDIPIEDSNLTLTEKIKLLPTDKFNQFYFQLSMYMFDSKYQLMDTWMLNRKEFNCINDMRIVIDMLSTKVKIDKEYYPELQAINATVSKSVKESMYYNVLN